MVSPIAREIPSTNDATMPETAAGTTIRVETCSLLDPSAGPVPKVTRHGRHGIFRERGHRRDDHHAHDEPGAQRVENSDADSDVLEVGCHPREREVAVNHRRDAGEELERRLERPAEPRAGVLAHEDGRAEPERDRDQGGPERDRERSHDQRDDAERLLQEEWGPLRAGDVVPEAHFLEELKCGQEKRDHDPDGGRHRDECAGGERRPDQNLAPALARRGEG